MWILLRVYSLFLPLSFPWQSLGPRPQSLCPRSLLNKSVYHSYFLRSRLKGKIVCRRGLIKKKLFLVGHFSSRFVAIRSTFERTYLQPSTRLSFSLIDACRVQILPLWEKGKGTIGVHVILRPLSHDRLRGKRIIF